MTLSKSPEPGIASPGALREVSSACFDAARQPPAATHEPSSFTADAGRDPETPLETACDRQLGPLLSVLLRWGVGLATAIVLAGGLLYLMRHGAEPVSYSQFLGEPEQLRSPNGILTATLTGDERGVVQLGLLVLIATPVLRVLVSMLTFISHRDLRYAVLTLVVMSGLLYSLLSAH